MTDNEELAPAPPGDDDALSARRGESLHPIRVVQDVSNFDHVEASDGIQRWQEQLRTLQMFKGLLLDGMHVALTAGDWGPIPIFADGHVVLLTKDDLNVLAYIIDPVFGVQQLACCQMRITNSNGHSCPPHIAAMESADAATSINQVGTPQKHKRTKKGTKALTPISNKKRKK